MLASACAPAPSRRRAACAQRATGAKLTREARELSVLVSENASTCARGRRGDEHEAEVVARGTRQKKLEEEEEAEAGRTGGSGRASGSSRGPWAPRAALWRSSPRRVHRASTLAASDAPSGCPTASLHRHRHIALNTLHSAHFYCTELLVLRSGAAPIERKPSNGTLPERQEHKKQSTMQFHLLSLRGRYQRQDKHTLGWPLGYGLWAYGQIEN